MNDVLAPVPLTEDALEQLVREAWSRVCDEPGISTYCVGGVRMERAHCFRLGVQIDQLVAGVRTKWTSGWGDLTVDSELHRAGSSPKLERREAPDLVVHVRGSDQFNLLALEAKHARRPSHNDLSKLQRLIDDRGYRFAWAIELRLDGPLAIVRCASTRNRDWTTAGDREGPRA